VGLKFAPTGSEMLSYKPQLLKSLPNCLDVHLSSVETLKAPVIEISQDKNIYFTKDLLHCTATVTSKNENQRSG
jgi:hypothetical protein